MLGKTTLAFVCALFCTMALGAGYAMAAPGGGVGAPDDPAAAPADPAPVTGPTADGSGGLPTGGGGLLLPLAPGEKAKLIKSGINKGLALAPEQAPAEVKAMIAAANQIALFKRFPYVYGAGHKPYSFVNGKPQLNFKAADCSGTDSWALAAAGLVKSPMPSGAYEKWGEEGYGHWVTVFANPGHMYLTIAGLRWDTGGNDDGTRWDARKRSASGYEVRHPHVSWNL